MIDTDSLRPALSVVLPCYRAARVAQRSSQALADALDLTGVTWELLVVDDGGHDFDDHPLPKHPNIRLLKLTKNLGKGAAVRTGMLAASGDVCLYTDIDLPYGIELLLVLYHHIMDGFHMAIGDRTMPGSHYAQSTPLGRQIISTLASLTIGSLVTGGFHDTQCGLKAFRRDVAEALFPLVSIDGFAFDVEVLYLALKHHLDIKRVPVQLRRNETSSVRLVRDSIRSLIDILGIKSRQLNGRYVSSSLQEIVMREAECALLRARASTPQRGLPNQRLVSPSPTPDAQRQG